MSGDNLSRTGHRHTASDVRGGKFPLAMLPDEVATDVEVTAAIDAAFEERAGWDPGDIKWSARAAPAPGWLEADGSAVSRSTYADLFAAIGTTYGAGNGSTTFNLPNLKGRVLVGHDATQAEFDAVGETGGAKTHTLTTAEMPSHAHDIEVGSGGNAVNAARVSGNGTGGTGATAAIWTAPIKATGGGAAHNNLQPYIVLKPYIRT